MKTPLLLTLGSLAALLVALAGGWKQRSEAGALRLEVESLAGALAAAPAPAAAAPANVPPVAPEVAPLTPEERLELARLRNQVTRLRGEVKGLAALRHEHDSLTQRLATARANPGSPLAALPPGFILRRTARNAGQASPEATVETFLWAVEHRDANALVQTLVPELGQRFAADLKREGASFWDGASKLPGLRIVESAAMPDGTMQLKLAIEPDGTADMQTMKVRQVDGLWRLEMR